MIIVIVFLLNSDLQSRAFIYEHNFATILIREYLPFP